METCVCSRAIPHSCHGTYRLLTKVTDLTLKCTKVEYMYMRIQMYSSKIEKVACPVVETRMLMHSTSRDYNPTPSLTWPLLRTGQKIDSRLFCRTAGIFYSSLNYITNKQTHICSSLDVRTRKFQKLGYVKKWYVITKSDTKTYTSKYSKYKNICTLFSNTVKLQSFKDLVTDNLEPSQSAT